MSGYECPAGNFSLTLVPAHVGELTLSAGITSNINLNYAHHKSPVGSVGMSYNGLGFTLETGNLIDSAANTTIFFSGSREPDIW